MDFPFAEICTLLQRLEDIEHSNILQAKDKAVETKGVIESWFKSHRRKINELSVSGATALLSTLLPAWRTDRVYGTKTANLHRTICRALRLSVRQMQILEAFKQPGHGDFSSCLERVVKDLGPPGEPAVKLDEVDDLLQMWAGLSSFSDPSVPKLPLSSSEARDKSLGNILKRVRPQQGKWLARLILKDFSPVQVDEHLVLTNFHFLLPDLLRFQKSFSTATTLLQNELREFPEQPDPRSARLLRRQVDERIGVRPIVGTKISRPEFHKARSIDSCIKTLDSQRWVVERKYDGEYCEIHVDMTKSVNPLQCIQIFSKSGKDSTDDRKGILSILVQTLCLGRKECRFKRQAIILGELVVFSDEEDDVMPFEEIRKHVTRSGRRLGADEDSPPKAHEHLAIVFFDLLLLDSEIIMNKPVEERRLWLRKTYKKLHGRAIGAEWKEIDFSAAQSRKRLVHQFAASNARRCEGLVLKRCGVPYFSMEPPIEHSRNFIKLKKDYIVGLGDEADFAVIGASYDAQLAITTGLKNVKWTTFHLACLMNKEAVRRMDTRPVFRYVGTIDCAHCVPKAALQVANSLANFVASPYDRHIAPSSFDIVFSQPLKMEVVLNTPLVFEVLGSGFEKPSNCGFLMLRHPRAKKLHEDRSWKDCISFQELQEQGIASRAAPADSESQETRRWIGRLELSCKAKFQREKSASPTSRVTSTPTGSVVSLSQRLTPIRPSTKRTVDALPTPLPSSAIIPVSSSPLERVLPLEHKKASTKRLREDDCHAQARAKKARSELSERLGRTPRTPTSSPPLVEISSNAVTNPAQPCTRTDGYPTFLANLTTSTVSSDRSSLQTDSQPDLEASTAACASSNCPFNHAAILLAPCIATTPYITDNLLSLHQTTITSDLTVWNRDSFAHKPLTETLSESQSYPGMRKIVLVERKRRAVVKALIRNILRLNDGRFRERIDVFDWRVLEECPKHITGAEFLKRNFLGATMFDDVGERALFVSNCAWLLGCEDWVDW